MKFVLWLATSTIDGFIPLCHSNPRLSHNLRYSAAHMNYVRNLSYRGIDNLQPKVPSVSSFNHRDRAIIPARQDVKLHMVKIAMVSTAFRAAGFRLVHQILTAATPYSRSSE